MSPAPQKWSDEEMLEAAREHQAVFGHWPTVEEWREPTLFHRPHADLVRRRWPSWEAFLRAAGWTGKKADRKPSSSVVWTEERIGEAMLDHVFLRGSWPTQAEWEYAPEPGEPPRPTSDTVKRRFGSFDAGRRAAGYTGRVRGGKTTAVGPSPRLIDEGAA